MRYDQASVAGSRLCRSPKLYDKKFYHKKQLLVKRDELLEDIGRQIFKEGNLPERFNLMGKEFHSTDILIRQLEDRLRALTDEWERVHNEDLELLSCKSKLERRFEKMLNGPKQDLNALHLKIEYQKDQMRSKLRLKKDSVEESLPLLESKASSLSEQICGMEKDLKEQISQLRAQWEPLQDRLQMLDKGILKVQKEMDQLKSSHSKRLRNLAWHYFDHKLEKETYGEQYRTLADLKAQMADNTREVRYDGSEFEKVEKDHVKWRGFLAMVLAAVFIGYYFRTQFQEQQDSLAAICTNFIPEQGDFRIFANLNAIDGRKIRNLIPDFAELPSGEMVFQGMEKGEIQHFLLGRDVGENLLFCGLKLARPPARFEMKLTQNGWQYLPTSNWKALTDGEDWVWLILNEREFFLFPRTYLAAFEKLDLLSLKNLLNLRLKINPFDNNSPILQGFDKLNMTLGGESFRMEIYSDRELPQMTNRTQRLELLTKNTKLEGLKFQMESGRLHISGPKTLFTPDSYTADGLKDFVDRKINQLEEGHKWYPSKQKTSDIAQVFSANPTDQRLMVLGVEDSQLRLLSEIRVGASIRDLAYLNKTQVLLAIDENDSELLHLQVKGPEILLDHRMTFRDIVGEDFKPELMAQTPDEKHLAILGSDSPKQPPKLVFVDLQNLSITQTETLPKEIREGLSLCWSQDGKALYVGVASKKGRGNYSLAVVVYHKEDAVLRPFRFIDLPHEGTGVHVSSLAWRRDEGALYLYQSPHQKIVRYGMESTPVIKSLHLGTGGSKDVFTRQLHLNRTQDHALLVGSEPQLENKASFLYLAKLEDGGPILADTADLGFTPFQAERIPLSDRFWITGPRDRTLARIRIQNGKLKTELIQQLQWQPEYLALDKWGAFLFISGKDK